MPATSRSTAAARRRQGIILLGFLVFCGLVATAVGFVPDRDLADYRRLVDGAGTRVAATSAGGVAVPFSGAGHRAGGGRRILYCTSWRYEIGGAPRFFT